MSFKDVMNSLLGQEEDDELYDMDDLVIKNTSIETKGGKLKYLLFEFEKEKKPGSGDYVHVYKAIKLVKIKRVPKKDLTLASFLQMQEGVITGYYQAQVNYIQIFANIIKPQRLGLIFAYGCQGISNESMEDAKIDADLQMAAVERGITGTFRTLEYDDLTQEDARWIFQKLGNMSSLRVIRGVPVAKKTNGRGTVSNFMTTSTADVEEQSEEFLMGMDTYEYLFVLTATSIDMDVISRWKEQYLKESTYWASLQTGQKSMTFGLSMPMVYAANVGSSEGWGSNTGKSFGENWGNNSSVSDGNSYGVSNSTSHGVSNSVSHGTSSSTSHSQGTSDSAGTSHSVGTGTNVGKSAGTSIGNSTGYSTSTSSGTNSSYGSSLNISHGTGTNESAGVSTNESQGWGTSHTIGSGTSHSTSDGTSHTVTDGTSVGSSSSWSSGGSHTTGTTLTDGTNHNEGTTGGLNASIFGIGGSVSGTTTDGASSSEGHTVSDVSSWSSGGTSSSSSSHSVSNGTSHSVSNGTSTSVSNGTSTSNSNGLGNSYSLGTSVSDSISGGVSTSSGASFSQGSGNSIGSSYSANLGTSLGASKSLSNGTSTSSGISESVGTSSGVSDSVSSGTSDSVSSGTSSSTSHTVSNGTSTGLSRGTSIGNSISSSTTKGSSSSMGMGPSLSFGRSFAWEDKEVTHIQDLLTYSCNRMIMASNGEGAWFTDIYIATDSEAASNSATQLAMSAWHGTTVLTSPLQVYKPSQREQEYLFKHLSVFSPSTKREGVPGQFESYKYSTILLSEEMAAYSHPPRANIGGIQAAIDDPPVLTIPGDRQNGEIFIGYVADVEKYNKEKEYKSDFRYTIRNSELHHAYISGASRSGKTVVARRLVAEAYNNCRRGEKKKRLRFLIMDPKQDWRALAKVIPNDHFRFYSLSNPLFHPIKMNLLRIPRGVYTERYADKLREIFIRSYGLGDRAFQILGKAINDVYREAGCYDENVKYNLKDPQTGIYPATERSKSITLEDVCKKLQFEIDTAKQKDKAEAIQRILDRMDTFNSPESSVYTIFCNRGEEGMGIDNLLGNDDVIVLESYGMDTKTSAFVFGLITSGVYQYAVSNGGFVEPDDQYETVLVIEEANQVLIGQDEDNLGGSNPFENILDQSAGYGLFIWTLTQKIADMPDSVLANSAIKIIGRQDRKDDIEMSIVQIGKDGLIADRVFKNWLPDQPTGWFIIKSSRNGKFTQNAPCHVLVEYMDVAPPKDNELDTILRIGEVERTEREMQKEIEERDKAKQAEEFIQSLYEQPVYDSEAEYTQQDFSPYAQPVQTPVKQDTYQYDNQNQYHVQATSQTDGRFENYSPYGTFSMNSKN